jgi:tRNA dimethylallyltransferase
MSQPPYSQAQRPRAILIAGPTASGKSALALKLAAERNGVIINADSMQVYADLSLLTARPTDEDLHQAPHAMYGFVAATDAYSVGRWLVDATDAINEAHSRQQMPIIVGGTGLYFLALLNGLSPIPEPPADIRRHWRDQAGRLGPGALHQLLASRDAETAARLAPADTQRITRALEVLDATGRSLSHWQRQPGVPVLDADTTERLLVSPPRAVLHARANQRFDQMMATGAIDEVAWLASLDLSPELPVMRALGVRPLLEYLAGHLDRDAAIDQAKAETRQYQKRQLTWIKRQMNAWNEVNL